MPITTGRMNQGSGAVRSVIQPSQGAPRAQLHHPFDQRFDHHVTAMAMQLEHVFAGEGVWCGEVDREAQVEQFALGILPAGEDCAPGRRQLAQQHIGHFRHHWSGYAHNRHPAAPRRCRCGDNGVGRRGPRAHGLSCARAAPRRCAG
jgi:hypothetical protein